MVRTSVILLVLSLPAATLLAVSRSVNDKSSVSLSYSTLLGGDFSQATRMAVDNQGNAYILGETNSLPFPGITRVVKASGSSAPGNIFVTKLDPGGRLVYSTLLTGNYICHGIAVDHSGNVYIAGRNSNVGRTAEYSLVATPGAFQVQSTGNVLLGRRGPGAGRQGRRIQRVAALREDPRTQPDRHPEPHCGQNVSGSPTRAP